MQARTQEGKKELRCFNVRDSVLLLWCLSPPLAVFTFLVHELGNHREILAYVAFITVVHGESTA